MSADHGHGPDHPHTVPPPEESASPPGHHPTEKPHPTWSTYWKVAVILTVITIVEVWAYYIPAWVESRTFVPSLLIMSAAKFAIVVMFYMHLRYDHKLFRALFTGPLMVAVITVIALLFLFGRITVRIQGG
ncbi:MAG TPA: cytochrome C oxidase subunit IV family protein [Gemmatimonadaceae bacterium]|nr:cytochrome C oxidase subunit IV family protein [Gemmatimonadaceae bacterium]